MRMRVLERDDGIGHTARIQSIFSLFLRSFSKLVSPQCFGLTLINHLIHHFRQRTLTNGFLTMFYYILKLKFSINILHKKAQTTNQPINYLSPIVFFYFGNWVRLSFIGCLLYESSLRFSMIK